MILPSFLLSFNNHLLRSLRNSALKTITLFEITAIYDFAQSLVPAITCRVSPNRLGISVFTIKMVLSQIFIAIKLIDYVTKLLLRLNHYRFFEYFIIIFLLFLIINYFNVNIFCYFISNLFFNIIFNYCFVLICFRFVSYLVSYLSFHLNVCHPFQDIFVAAQ